MVQAQLSPEAAEIEMAWIAVNEEEKSLRQPNALTSLHIINHIDTFLSYQVSDSI